MHAMRAGGAATPAWDGTAGAGGVTKGPNQRRKRGRRAGRKVNDMIDDQGS